MSCWLIQRSANGIWVWRGHRLPPLVRRNVCVLCSWSLCSWSFVGPCLTVYNLKQAQHDGKSLRMAILVGAETAQHDLDPGQIKQRKHVAIQ